MNDRAILKRIFFKAIHTANGYNAVCSHVKLANNYIEISRKRYSLSFFKKIIVVGAGKACYDMAKGIEELLGPVITDGLIITKYNHGGPLKRINVSEASHPLPDMNGVKATKQILSMANKVDQHTLVIVLLSGGASSLLVAPDGISLKDKITATSLLLKAGANIDELNIVRKHLSLVKGGKLAQIFYPAQIITLIISDVIDNKLDIIGSGPTYPDPSTPQQAIEVIKRYKLEARMPAAIIKSLKNKASQETTNNPHALYNKHVRHIILSDNRLAINSCRQEAIKLGLKPFVLTTSLHGEAREVGHVLASIAEEIYKNKKRANKRLCLISGGETTVTVKGNGKGGRNQELALAFAMDIQNKGISMLSAGTDGTDGPTDAAGAIVDGATVTRIKRLRMDPLKYFINNDTYTVLNKIGALLKTCPTGTNVMDIQLILI